MRSVIVFNANDKLELLRKGLRSRRGPQDLFHTFSGLELLIRSGQKYEHDEVVVFIDSYLELRYPELGGPKELTSGAPGMRAMELVRERRPSWTILSLLHGQCVNDELLSMEMKDVGGTKVGMRAHYAHSTDVSKWYTGVLQSAINLAIKHRSLTKKPARPKLVSA